MEIPPGNDRFGIAFINGPDHPADEIRYTGALVTGARWNRWPLYWHWVAEGGYEPVAEVLFNQLNVDGYFLEYDDERSGDFAPLRFVPANKTVVLGLVTSKVGDMETREDLMQRVEEAAKYMPIEQMCLSPQCGFSSTVHGNDITEDQQWAKLELIAKTAQEIWG